MILDKKILKAETIPHVELDFMNNTHFEEVQMVEQLGQMIITCQENEKCTEKEINSITERLNNWLHHTQTHFNRENDLMVDIGFPAYPIHSGEHEKVFADMKSIVEAWRDASDIDLLANYVFSAWPEWFDAHVNSMDMMTAKFAMMQGYKPDSRPPSPE